MAATWYVRPDGGSRYSEAMRSGQCDGLADAPYRGKGKNQHCAFRDVRSLFQDGAWANGDSKFPAWGWVGRGGDTYIIRGSIADGVSYRIGWDNPSSAATREAGQDWGMAGNPYASGMPPPPSGTPSQHTRILGGNYGSCHAASARTQLHGGYGIGAVLSMAGSSYVDIACLDMTDFSSCGRSGQQKQCHNAIGALDDFAGTGISWSRTSTHDSVTDVRIHGMATAGMVGPTGDGVVFDYLDLMGNASSGWNADAGNRTTGTGSLLVKHYNISWNGCAEEYPIHDKLPYQDCTDDGSNGYGDGFGTATLDSNPGWLVTFDQGVVSYNTQDGLDALHIGGNGSVMTVSHTLAFGNMGQQIKVGGAEGRVLDNVIYTSCNALRQPIPGTPAGYNSKLSDFCRAADTGVVVTVNDGSTTQFERNTLLSAATTAIQVSVNSSCKTDTCLIQQRDNIFVGFDSNKETGYVPGSGDFSNPIYLGPDAARAYRSPGSSFEHNVTFHARSNWRCPAKFLNERSALCGDPHLVDESWHNYGYGNPALTHPLQFGDTPSARTPGATWNPSSGLPH
jgi:hypothetical protein